MGIYHKESRMADAIWNTPELIPLVNRFGIFLGVGHDSIADICESQGVDTDFFLAMINTFVNSDYFPERELKSYDISKTVDYLKKTDAYYRDIQLPNIERHFRSLVMRSEGENNSITLLQKFFEEMRNELLARIERDNEVWFPAILRSSAADKDVLKEFVEAASAVEDKVNDLCRFFTVHLRGNYDRNLCMAVVTALFSLSRDIRQNDRIRDRILKPSIAERLTLP